MSDLPARFGAEGDGKRPLPETPAFMKTNERANMSEQTWN
jgi:hypothetical protein